MPEQETTEPNGMTMKLVAHELSRAAECRNYAIRWNSPQGPIWHGSWSARDWIQSARDHITLARRLRFGMSTDKITTEDWLLTPEEMAQGSEIAHAPMQNRCSAIPIVAEREKNCREPYHWEDGVPYCDTCGLFRASVGRPL